MTPAATTRISLRASAQPITRKLGGGARRPCPARLAGAR